jgi:hypothetical protein
VSVLDGIRRRLPDRKLDIGDLQIAEPAPRRKSLCVPANFDRGDASA